ncbi:MAG TPA: hypothetical protein VK119_06760 [Bacillota bacterium]|nr:hypothetical protein [Bacillota bacterium]
MVFLTAILLLLGGLLLGIIIHKIQEKKHSTRNYNTFIFKSALTLSIISAILGIVLLHAELIYLGLFIFIPAIAILAIDDLLSYE